MTGHPIPAAALDQHIAIVGKTGSGKTYAAKGVVEELLANRARVTIIDPTGVYWGLRLAGDGKRASGYDVAIFGGRHADLPLDAGSGDAIAEAVGSSSTPVIIDTQMMSVAGRTHFFTAFAEGLLRHNRGPLHLVIDEAHLFAPQAGGQKAAEPAPMMLHAANNLVALGRSSGLRIILITQRPAKLHKDALTQVEALVALRLVAPQDRKAIEQWVSGQADAAKGRELVASLAGLPRGTGWIWAPEQAVLTRAAFPAIATYDSGKPIEAGAAAPSLRPIDLAALRAALAVKRAPGRRQATRAAESRADVSKSRILRN